MDQSILHIVNFYVKLYILLQMILIYIHDYHLSKIYKILLDYKEKNYKLKKNL